MKKELEGAVECLTQLIHLYGRLLEKEGQMVEFCLTGALESADRSRQEQESLAGQVRQVHRELRGFLADLTMSELADSGDSGMSEALEAKRYQLGQVVAELQLTINRNRRFIRNSLAYYQGILQHSLSGMSQYSGDGFLQAPDQSLRSGVRA